MRSRARTLHSLIPPLRDCHHVAAAEMAGSPPHRRDQANHGSQARRSGRPVAPVASASLGYFEERAQPPDAMPRKTTMARFSRTMSASDSSPARSPRSERWTVVILSTMSRHA